MPMGAMSMCTEQGCRTLLARPGKCLGHKRQPWQHAIISARTYGTYAHKQARAEAIRREPICYICKQKPSSTVDHVVPKAEGGTDHPSNLRGCCSDCQQAKASREGARARARNRRATR